VTLPPKLLIVDDGDRYAEMALHFMRGYRYATRCTLPGPCWTCPRRQGCTLTHAHDAGELDQALAQHDDVDVVLLDVAFDVPPERLLPSNEPDQEKRRRFQGLAILAHLRKRHPALSVILMTSKEDLAYEDAAAALEVDEYVTLAGSDAFDARAVGLLVERIWARRPRASLGEAYEWGKGSAMSRLKREATVLARTSLPLLILGETGTGKSALAEQVIHPASSRKGPFLAVDLSALPSNLVAAELFGTVRGAFSGALDRPGRFEQAHGGTLFLDEIGNLPLDLQRLLLLALEGRRITRLGESLPRQVDVRLIAATNTALATAVRAGTFRADLYARLNPSAKLALPPLRERLDDLPALMTRFLQRAFQEGSHRTLLEAYAKAHGLPAGLPVALDMGKASNAGTAISFVWASRLQPTLRAYPWPGNLRELDHVTVTTAVFALADALQASETARAATENPCWIPIPARLIHDLLKSPQETGGGSAGAGTTWAPAATLHDWVTGIEHTLLANLFKETGGDFAAMAARLLTGSPARNARRVRLRFNQLGLRVRAGRGRLK
jgi:DNA-binding NtrC family response regulator